MAREGAGHHIPERGTSESEAAAPPEGDAPAAAAMPIPVFGFVVFPPFSLSFLSVQFFVLPRLSSGRMPGPWAQSSLGLLRIRDHVGAGASVGPKCSTDAGGEIRHLSRLPAGQRAPPTLRLPGLSRGCLR